MKAKDMKPGELYSVGGARWGGRCALLLDTRPWVSVRLASLQQRPQSLTRPYLYVQHLRRAEIDDATVLREWWNSVAVSLGLFGAGDDTEYPAGHIGELLKRGREADVDPHLILHTEVLTNFRRTWADQLVLDEADHVKRLAEADAKRRAEEALNAKLNRAQFAVDALNVNHGINAQYNSHGLVTLTAEEAEKLAGLDSDCDIDP